MINRDDPIQNMLQVLSILSGEFRRTRERWSAWIQPVEVENLLARLGDEEVRHVVHERPLTFRKVVCVAHKSGHLHIFNSQEYAWDGFALFIDD